MEISKNVANFFKWAPVVLILFVVVGLSLGDMGRPEGSEAAGSSVTVVEDCTEDVPLPNGGCRAVRVDGLNPAEWYTFGNALRTGGG